MLRNNISNTIRRVSQHCSLFRFVLNILVFILYFLKNLNIKKKIYNIIYRLYLICHEVFNTQKKTPVGTPSYSIRYVCHRNYQNQVLA